MSSGIQITPDKEDYSPAEHRIVFDNVRWSTYEQLLEDLASQSAPRLTFSKGLLEIMAPFPQHERLSDIIEMLVKSIADATNRNAYCLRSTTFKRKDIERGFEPDSCFYVENEASVLGKDKIDLDVDPAPDLIVEIDITRSSIDKFSIFEQMRIPEVWRHDGLTLSIYHLTGDGYSKRSNSYFFPEIDAAVASEFIRLNKNLSSKDFRKALRAWITNLVP